ncbi:C-Jun-amino-terminal kinase-interacting protein 4-like isoform X5 [Ylistrum balloti]|uniref:C-Jun-amino-terminal kinase-interacting protein 4-like isoform X5 n=1 Tax=Ylistrum balloti TaxID=509963 RepID=UPI00290589E7|nr:C-Jun-amino-terminal kinase-interacting protein 4-like isoform X5 [Ylistrum balloti]
MAAISETVYGTIEEGHVMSEKVSSLATNVYKEFERMIKKYDEDVVKELMPLTVALLEGLDQALNDKQESEVELELLRDDNEQLLTQYEREKQLRKAAEQKYLEMEDGVEGQKKEHEEKVESMESIIRMLELKSKNATDHVARMEEKDSEWKKEYTKLHERYTELFRTHMDQMERTKILMGTDKLELSNSPRNKGFQLPNLRPVSMVITGQNLTPLRSSGTPPSLNSLDIMSPRTPADSNISLKSELGDLDSPDVTDKRRSGKKVGTCDKEQLTDNIMVKEFGTTPSLDTTIAHIVATTPELQELEESIESQTPDSGVRRSLSRRNNDSIFDELNVQDVELGDDFGITGREVTPGDYSSSGMGKELENLILENTELLETKNALNIVKDDLIAKVDELSSEQEILREEITSLQAVKTKLQGRIKDLEEDLKKTKEELEKKKSGNKEEEEDDVPMAQRKRFTRVEMARVLMERNQYKERLMELQEAVRWTEMIRASREHPEVNTTPSKQKKSSIWNFFSNLFSSPNKPTKRPLPMATIKYNAPTTQVQPVGDPNKRTRSKLNLGEKAKAYDFLQDDLSSKIEDILEEPVLTQPKMSEKAKKEREKERREQYKQVRAHVKKDDGRLQAYGWSLPAKFQPSLPNRETPSKSHVPVPVPVYCRPLFDKESGLKIWCAVGVNLTGGQTRDGGSVVGASVFYSNLSGANMIEAEKSSKKDSSKDEVERLNQELKEHEKNLKDTEKEQLSSFVWICTQTSTCSRVSVIDANNPGDILETFRVSTSPILCIASVAGALESDYRVDEEILKAESYPQYKPPPEPDNLATSVTDSGIGGITLVQCATGGAAGSPNTSPVGSPHKSDGDSLSAGGHNLSSSEEKLDTSVEHKDKTDTESLVSERSYEAAFGSEDVPSVFKARGSPVSSGTATPTSTSSSRSLDRRALQEQADLVRDGISPLPLDSDLQYEEAEKMSSVLPTMWLGSQSGSLYVHSSVAQWRRCLHSVKLRDSVLNIVHLKGRVLAALADGTVAIFHRDTEGQWDLQNYHLLDLGRPHHSIRCMTVIANKHVWCGYRNKIHVVDPEKMNIEKTFDAHPRKESQVRQVAWLGDGVWVSIRLDSTLRLYHAYTHVHLQDVDIEPYVSKMLGTGKLGFSFVRITAMLISCNRLWIGTGNGVVISVPLSESNKQTVTTASSGGRPGGIIRVYSDNKSDNVTPGSFIPYCSMAQAQLSFHGHRDAVKFFAAVPATYSDIYKTSPGAARRGMSAVSDVEETTNRHEAVPATNSNTKLVLSGGEGYVDFRIGDGDDEEFIDEEKKVSLSKGDRSHLIVWEVACTE